MKVAVVGSRTLGGSKQLIYDTLNSLQGISMVISGGAKGVDTIAEKWALENQIPTTIFYPDWELYGKSAGPIRNEHIVKNCDMIIAFWDGSSPGTKNSINLAERYGKKVRIIQIQ